MKKTISLILIMLLSITIFTACTQDVGEVINETTVEAVVERMEKGETFAFIMGSDSCEACKDYKENLAELKDKEDVVLDYINFNEEKEEDVIDLLITHLGENIDNGLSTPTTYFIKDGKHTGHPAIGSIKKSEIVEVYKEGFDKEPREDSVNPVTVNDVIKKVKNKETFAFIVGSNTCPACLQYKNSLSELQQKEDVKLDYIDIDNENDEILGELLVDVLGADLSEGLSTPTTYFIIEGVSDGEPIVGAMGPDKAISEYKNFIEKSTK